MIYIDKNYITQKKTIKVALLVVLFSLLGSSLFAQTVGDTIKVQAMDFANRTKNVVVNFPDDENLTYEKILLKYTMRCKNNAVSTTTERNLGCGEWDYTNNTFIIDSTKFTSTEAQIAKYKVTNYTGTSFSYMDTPTYNYVQEQQTTTTITSTNSEINGIIGGITETDSEIIPTDFKSGRTQFIYTALELTSAGFSAGSIDGISLNIVNAGEAQFLKVKVKEVNEQEFTPNTTLDGFTEVYHKNTSFNANQANRIQFHTPYNWDGTSSLVFDFSFNNVGSTNISTTEVSSEISTTIKGLFSNSNDSNFLFANNNYIEISGYNGVQAGTTNVTVETWIKTTATDHQEIVGWGTNTQRKKFVFRLMNNGRLRFENGQGNSQSTTAVNDGKWHHVAMVIDGNNLSDVKFFIDGVLETNSTTGSTALEITSDLVVRLSKGVNDRYFSGEIDQFKIWNTNLSEETINNWKSFVVTDSHPNYANLDVYYDFNDTQATFISDLSPNNRDGIIKGDKLFTKYEDAENAFKEFIFSNQRPSVTIYQGDYVLSNVANAVEKPIEKELKHILITNTIEVPNPIIAVNDIVNTTQGEVWATEEIVFDTDGNTIITRPLTADNQVDLTEMISRTRRSPFFNEIVSFVTPYGIGLDLGEDGIVFTIDLSDFALLLKGEKRLIMPFPGKNAEELNLEFQFIVGTPPRDVLQYEQIWQATNVIGNASPIQIRNDVKFESKDILLDPNAVSFKLKSSITGHGPAGEFHQNGGPMTHMFTLNGDTANMLQWDITQECSTNPVFPQGGTWIYDRQGWCPGQRTLLKEHDITNLVTPGQNNSFDYNISVQPDPGGVYRYEMAHQVVGYGNINHQIDASIKEITSPNNEIENLRDGVSCGNPKVILQNKGAQNLTSATIQYWINDATVPMTYAWTGNLSFMESEIIELESSTELWQEIQNTNNLFHAEVINPNDGNDEYEHNNKFTSSFDLVDEHSPLFSFIILTNHQPTQNSVTLTDSNGVEFFSNNNFTNPNTQYRENAVLPDGCYNLRINDSGQDGLRFFPQAQSEVGAMLAVSFEEDNTTITLQNLLEPNFGSYLSYNFFVGDFFTLSSDEYQFLRELSVYPNPTVDYCIIKSNDVSEMNVLVFDVIGKNIDISFSKDGNDSLKVDMRTLPSGTYFLKINNKGITTTRKVIKN